MNPDDLEWIDAEYVWSADGVPTRRQIAVDGPYLPNYGEDRTPLWILVARNPDTGDFWMVDKRIADESPWTLSDG